MKSDEVKRVYWSVAQVADQLGVSQNTIYAWLLKYGIVTVRRRHGPKLKHLIPEKAFEHLKRIANEKNLKKP